MILEVIATNVKDAIDAQKYGADRIELVSGIAEGGLTPSYSTIKNVLKHVTIPVHVMIRPHSRSFTYDQYDEEVILSDIDICNELGASGIVFGALTKEKKIDEKLLKKVCKRTNGMNFTFHRAIDEANDIIEALHILKQYQEITHILTSGGMNSAIDGEEVIKQMNEITKQTKIKILAGSGLSIYNVAKFIDDTNVKEVHFGSGVRKNQSSIEKIDSYMMEKLIEQLKHNN